MSLSGAVLQHYGYQSLAILSFVNSCRLSGGVSSIPEPKFPPLSGQTEVIFFENVCIFSWAIHVSANEWQEGGRGERETCVLAYCSKCALFGSYRTRGRTYGLILIYLSARSDYTSATVLLPAGMVRLIFRRLSYVCSESASNVHLLDARRGRIPYAAYSFFF